MLSMESDGQNSSKEPMFKSSDIESTKARTKTDYFVNLKRSNLFDKLSEKMDRQAYLNETEAKKRAEAEAAAREAKKKEQDASVDRFTKRETEVKVPTFVKMSNGRAPEPKETPVEKENFNRPAPVVPKIKSVKPATAKDKKIRYGVIAGVIFVLATAFTLWCFLAKRTITVTKETQIPDPIEEITLLDEVTTRRAEILELFTDEETEAGLAAYNEYLNETTDSETLSLIHSWRALDLYRLYRERFSDLILADVHEAEELKPTYATATLIYFFENEFGNADVAENYHLLASERDKNALQKE